MYYTEEMAKAFKSVKPVDGFSVDIYDNETHVIVFIPVQEVINLLDSNKADAVQYILDVKKALEDVGAIVQIIREALED